MRRQLIPSLAVYRSQQEWRGDDYHAGSVTRHSRRPNVVHREQDYHMGAIRHRYCYEPPSDHYIHDGVSRRQTHPVHMVSIQSETLTDTVILSQTLESPGAITADRYRR